ncbi:MAG: hypothetical protein BJ554DRAFT_307, partial [Olpidium bornovanus]
PAETTKKRNGYEPKLGSDGACGFPPSPPPTPPPSPPSLLRRSRRSAPRPLSLFSSARPVSAFLAPAIRRTAAAAEHHPFRRAHLFGTLVASTSESFGSRAMWNFQDTLRDRASGIAGAKGERSVKDMVAQYEMGEELGRYGGVIGGGVGGLAPSQLSTPRIPHRGFRHSFLPPMRGSYPPVPAPLPPTFPSLLASPPPSPPRSAVILLFLFHLLLLGF